MTDDFNPEDMFADMSPEALAQAMGSDVINVMVDASADLGARYYHRLIREHGVPGEHAAKITAAFVQGGMGTQ